KPRSWSFRGSGSSDPFSTILKGSQHGRVSEPDLRRGRGAKPCVRRRRSSRARPPGGAALQRAPRPLRPAGAAQARLHGQRDRDRAGDLLDCGRTGGPLLYNPPTSGVNAAILAVSCGVSVVSTVAASLGLTGGATNAPTSTTAIDSLTNTFLGGPTGQCSVYRVGTPSAAGTFFHPFGDVHTGALTVDNLGTAWIDIGGVFVVPPGYFASIAASATASTLVANLSMLYEEIPV